MDLALAPTGLARDLGNISELLAAELDLANAPLTERSVAAVIQFEGGQVVSGHNIEAADGFTHAEVNALAQAPDLPITAIHLAGKGHPKMSGYACCPGCTNALATRAKATTPVVLWTPTGPGAAMSFVDLQRANAHLETSDLRSVALDQELLRNTVLNTRDLQVVSEIARHAERAGVELLLTGTSSGRGGPSAAIARSLGRRYRDIDLIVLTDQPLGAVEQLITDAVQSVGRLGDGKTQRIAITDRSSGNGGGGGGGGSSARASHSLNEKREVSVLAWAGSGVSPIDLTVATTREDAFAYPTYLSHNWFHRIA